MSKYNSDYAGQVTLPYSAIVERMSPGKEVFVPCDHFESLSFDEHTYPCITAQKVIKASENLESKFVPPKNYQDLTDGFEVFHSSLSRETAVTLGLWGKLDVGAKDRFYLYHLAYYKAERDPDGYITNYYGSGIELNIKASNINVDASFNSLAAVAASTQLKKAEVTYRVRTFGLSGPLITDAIPAASGEYDINSHVELFKAVDKIKKAATHPSTVFSPAKMLIMRGEVTESDYIISMARIWALWCIRDGLSMKKAKRSMPNHSAIAKEAVDSVYQDIMGSFKPSQSPEKFHQMKAQNILDEFGWPNLSVEA